MTLIGIDPGPVKSAYVLLGDSGQPALWSIEPNQSMLATLTHLGFNAQLLAVEMVASYGMPVGAEIFDTCVWVGRFVERWGGDFRLIYRHDVKLHLTHQRNAKDSNIRQALIDRYGPGKARAVGLKATPGPLYGLTGDCWAALAVAVTAYDTGVFDGAFA